MSKGVLDLVGNTPIIKLRSVTPDRGAEVWLKYEAGNPTGSYEDRVAMSVLSGAISRNLVVLSVEMMYHPVTRLWNTQGVVLALLLPLFQLHSG